MRRSNEDRPSLARLGLRGMSPAPPACDPFSRIPLFPPAPPAHRAPPGIRVTNIRLTSVRPPGYSSPPHQLIWRGSLCTVSRLSASFLGLSLAILGLPGGARSAVGGDFRIRQRNLFLRRKRLLPLESITIFHDGVVYDCHEEPERNGRLRSGWRAVRLLNLKWRDPRGVDHRRIGGVYRSLAACGRQELAPW